MKKIITLIIVLIVVYFVFSKKEEEVDLNKMNEIRGIYISYIEFYNHFDNKNNEAIKKEIDKMLENINNYKFNLVFLHVRPFSDAIYNSNIFPYSKTLPNNKEKIDILEYFIDESHKYNIQVHAWINPYRISNQDDIKNISCDNPCYKWLGTNNIQIVKDKGIYYNPASINVENLIVEGIEEIIYNYDVDGIHFDDYFYTSGDIDKENYEIYLEKNKFIELNKYRYNIVNKLIKRVYKTIKEYDKNIIFSIAPDANIDNNYNKNYADVLKWVSEDNYIDYIVPQIYYGFENSNKPYVNTIIEWNNYIKNNTKLIPALAFYKIGKEDNYAGTGIKEWVKNEYIISNQIKVAKYMKKYKGYIIYRYDNFFDDSSLVLKEREEILKNIDLNK